MEFPFSIFDDYWLLYAASAANNHQRERATSINIATAMDVLIARNCIAKFAISYIPDNSNFLYSTSNYA